MRLIIATADPSATSLARSLLAVLDASPAGAEARLRVGWIDSSVAKLPIDALDRRGDVVGRPGAGPDGGTGASESAGQRRGHGAQRAAVGGGAQPSAAHPPPEGSDQNYHPSEGGEWTGHAPTALGRAATAKPGAAAGDDPPAGAVGPVEVAARLPAILRHRAAVRREIERERPDVLLTVDSPALHLPIAAWARRRGVRTVHLVCPQVWASRPWRVRALRRAADHVLCLLPFEPEILAGAGIAATFVGHPRAWEERPPPVGPPKLLLAPGSRPAELRQHLPVLREVARRARAARPDLRLIVARAPSVSVGDLAGLQADIVDDVRDAAAHVAVTASGTVTLELAALGIPQVVVYRMSPLSAWLARRLITVRHVALPNILAQRGVVPEHLQRLDPEAIAADAIALLGEAGEAQRQTLRPAMAAARVPDGMARAAALVRALAAGGAGPSARYGAASEDG